MEMEMFDMLYLYKYFIDNTTQVLFIVVLSLVSE